MISGVPFESDDSLDLHGLGAAMKAAVDAEEKFKMIGQQLVSLQIWQGRLIAKGSEKQAFVYFLPCKRCKEQKRE